MRWLLVLLIACSSKEPAKKPVEPVQPTQPTQPTQPPPVTKPEMCEVANAGPGYLFCKGKTYEGVIPSAGGDWTPSPMDVAEVEVALGPAITAHPELGKAHPAPDFKRMYTGVNVAGKKVIRVFLACQVDADWPSKGLPMVKDGGPCYGIGDFDMDSRTLTRLDANGSG